MPIDMALIFMTFS